MRLFTSSYGKLRLTPVYVTGSSSTQLLATLGSCFDVLHSVGDEIVVQRAGHEANIGPWVNLARRSGAKLSGGTRAPTDQRVN